MKRITLRVPDYQHVALSRLLTLERGERGNRYSLNDLCVRLLMTQLEHNGASLPRTGAPAPLGDGTMHILRTPPPPPVPRVPPTPMDIWTLRDMADEPQPERSSKPTEPTPVLEGNTVSEGVAETAECVPDEHAEELTDIAVAHMESEGGPDGQAD